MTGHIHGLEPEPVWNASSNAAYGLAGLAYLAYAMTLPWGAGAVLSLITCVGLCVLCAGSWMYHAHATVRNNLYDHVGMHAALSSMSAWSAWLATGSTTVGFCALGLYTVATLLFTGMFDNIKGYTLAHSRRIIAGHAAILFVLLSIAAWQAALIAVQFFALAFAFHDDNQNTPTHFGPNHAVWHVLTAVGFAVPPLWLLFQ